MVIVSLVPETNQRALVLSLIVERLCVAVALCEEGELAGGATGATSISKYSLAASQLLPL